MSRLNLVREALRPKMSARAMFQGPQGSGKTWTMLSVARHLVANTKGRIIMLDTERESALTYADVFTFQHLPWQPPYSPDELTADLDLLATHGEPAVDLNPLSFDDVLCIDSLSHFWQGRGGILDIAGGKVHGGWDRARPMQTALVDQLLAMPCHLLLAVRMKNSVLVSDGGKTIENVGLTVIQDDTLAYEVNVVVQLDMQHNITVMKSRTPAVPVGRMYPGGMQVNMADDYLKWLAGGIPPANRDDVDRIVAMFAGIADKEASNALKRAFVAEFGMPHSLTADKVPSAMCWLDAMDAPVGAGPAAAQAPVAAPKDPDAVTTAQDGGDVLEDPVPAPDGVLTPEQVRGMTTKEMRTELQARDEILSGSKATLEKRLLDALAGPTAAQTPVEAPDAPDAVSTTADPPNAATAPNPAPNGVLTPKDVAAMTAKGMRAALKARGLVQSGSIAFIKARLLESLGTKQPLAGLDPDPDAQHDSPPDTDEALPHQAAMA